MDLSCIQAVNVYSRWHEEEKILNQGKTLFET
jgi:hypothetical protein